MAWSPPATAVAGVVATAAWFNQYVRDNFKAIGDPWTSYTPTYRGISAIGNATVIAKYIAAGKFIHGYAQVTFGSTTTFDGNPLSVSLPVTPILSVNLVVGSAFCQDTSTGTYRGGTVITNNAATAATVCIFDGGGVVTGNTGVPFVWANTDIYSIFFAYEAA